MTVEPPVVLFADNENWRCFDQLAGYLRRHGIRPIRLLVRRPASWLRRLTDRLLYDEVVMLGEPGAVERLRRLVESGAVLDAHLSELTLVTIGAELDTGPAILDLLAVSALG